MKPLRMYTQLSKTKLYEIKEELKSYDVNLTMEEITNLTYGELVEVLSLARKKRELEMKMAKIIYKDYEERA